MTEHETVTTNLPDDVRHRVSRDYAAAVSRAPSCGCCGTTEPGGDAAKLGGYATADLAALPGDAVRNSFGCGNPVAFGGVQAGDTVLDLGSGAGIDLLLAAQRVGPTGRVIGVDMTTEMIDRARANLSEAGVVNAEVREGIIEALPVDDASVDWVISNCVINLSPEKPRVFSEIARVLRPGGQFAISDIVVTELPDEMRKITALYSGCVGGAISEDDYLDGLRAAGFADAHVIDRIVYTREQLDAFACTGADTCGCGGPDADVVETFAAALDGKVWSAAFRGSRNRE